MLTGAAPGNRREGRVRVHVATTGTIFQFQHGVVDRGRINLLVRRRPKITRMTTSAVGSVRGISPGTDFIVRRVTGATEHPGPMRPVIRCCMRIGRHRTPGGRVRMASIASLSRYEVTTGFARG